MVAVDIETRGSRKAPRVSIFHMTYNQLEGLQQGIEASLSQDYTNLEIVFADDHSTDGTYELVEEIVAQYDGPHDLRLFRNLMNLGLVGNLNTCAERTEGQFIVQANGDDISHPERVSRLVERWQGDQDVMLVHSASQYLGFDGQPGEYCNTRPAADFQNTAAAYVIYGYFALGASAAFDRRIFEHFGPVPEYAVVEDCIMPLRARILGKVLKIEENLVWLRPGGVSDNSDESKKLDFERYAQRRRFANASAYIEDLRKTSFNGKWRVVLACHLVILDGRLRESGFGPARAVVRPVLRRAFRSIKWLIYGKV